MEISTSSTSQRSQSIPHLLPEGLFEQSLETLTIIKSRGIPLEVELNGGIGDHLEALSLIIYLGKTFDVALNLVMSKERQQQIEPLTT